MTSSRRSGAQGSSGPETGGEEAGEVPLNQMEKLPEVQDRRPCVREGQDLRESRPFRGAKASGRPAWGRPWEENRPELVSSGDGNTRVPLAAPDTLLRVFLGFFLIQPKGTHFIHFPIWLMLAKLIL